MRDDVPVYILSRSDDSAILAVNASMKNLLEKIAEEHKDNELIDRQDILAHMRVNGLYECTLGGVKYNLKRSQLKAPIGWTR